MGETTDFQCVVEKAHLLMTIDEKPENVTIPSNAIAKSTLGSLQTRTEDLTQQVAASATQPTQRPS